MILFLIGLVVGVIVGLAVGFWLLHDVVVLW